MNTRMENQTIPLSVVTRDGEFIAHYSERGLVSLDFPSGQSGQSGSPNGTPSAQVRGWHRKTTAAIKDTLAGRAVKNLPPLDFPAGRNSSARSGRPCKKSPRATPAVTARLRG